MRRTAPAWGLAQFGREVLDCPRRPLEVIKPWQARLFTAVELAPVGAKALDVMRIMAPRGHNTYKP